MDCKIILDKITVIHSKHGFNIVLAIMFIFSKSYF